MKKTMAVVSAQEKFAGRYCEYLNDNAHIMFCAVPFADMEAFRAYRKEHPVPLLLCDSDILKDASARDDMYGIRTIPLSGDRKEKRNGAVFMYQSAEALTREIMDCCGDMKFASELFSSGKSSKVIGVYSPAPEIRKTLFAFTLSASLRKNGRVIYLNFEEFSGLKELTGEQYDRGLSNALYYMKQGGLNGHRIASMIYSFGGVDYIPPVRSADDMNAVSGSECAELVETVLAETLYDTAVVDMPRTLSVSSELFDICESVYVPFSKGGGSSGIIKEFEEYLLAPERRKLKEKVRMSCIEDSPADDFADQRAAFAYNGPLHDMAGEKQA